MAGVGNPRLPSCIILSLPGEDVNICPNASTKKEETDKSLNPLKTRLCHAECGTADDATRVIPYGIPGGHNVGTGSGKCRKHKAGNDVKHAVNGLGEPFDRTKRLPYEGNTLDGTCGLDLLNTTSKTSAGGDGKKLFPRSGHDIDTMRCKVQKFHKNTSKIDLHPFSISQTQNPCFTELSDNAHSRNFPRVSSETPESLAKTEEGTKKEEHRHVVCPLRNFLL